MPIIQNPVAKLSLKIRNFTLGHDHEEVAVLGIFEVILHLLLTNEDNKERMYNIAMEDN